MTVQELIAQLESLKMPDAQVILYEEGDPYTPTLVQPVSLDENLSWQAEGRPNSVSIGC